MTLNEFKQLPREKQYRVILHTGVYLCNRYTSDLKAELYGIQGFYMEVYYNLPNEQIAYMKLFDHTEPLEPYLEGIDLKPLLHYNKS